MLFSTNVLKPSVLKQSVQRYSTLLYTTVQGFHAPKLLNNSGVVKRIYFCRFASSQTMTRDTTSILHSIRKLFKDRKIVTEELSAYIVPSCDAHDSEYLAEVDMRRQYVSGFTGSAGSALITSSQALMWTDGRYHLQARQEMDTNWMLMKGGLPDTPTQTNWMLKNLEPGSIVGVDPMLISCKSWAELSDQLEEVGCQLHAVDSNLVDIVWKADRENPQPDRPTNTVFPLELEFTGSSWQNRVERVRVELKKNNCGAIVLSALDDVAWLLNLRGSDIEFNPVFFSYCAVTLKEVVLFVESSQVTPAVRDSLTSEDMEGSVEILPYNKIKDYVTSLSKTTGKVWFSDTASRGLVSLLPSNKSILKLTPVALMKAIKNPVELKGFENCHIRDSAGQ